MDAGVTFAALRRATRSCGASAHRTGFPVRSTFTTEYGESCKSHIASANARIAESASQACPAL